MKKLLDLFGWKHQRNLYSRATRSRRSATAKADLKHGPASTQVTSVFFRADAVRYDGNPNEICAVQWKSTTRPSPRKIKHISTQNTEEPCGVNLQYKRIPNENVRYNWTPSEKWAGQLDS